jgi:regulatory protein
MDLRKKGIAKEIISDALQEVGGDETEEDRAYKVAEKKWQQLERRESDIKKRKQKLIAFLMSRSFSFDVIKKVVNKLSTNVEEEYDDA